MAKVSSHAIPSIAALTSSSAEVARVRPYIAPPAKGASGQGAGAPERWGTIRARVGSVPEARRLSSSPRSPTPVTERAQSRTLVPLGLRAHRPVPGVLGCGVTASREPAASRMRGRATGATTDSHVPAATSALPSSTTAAPSAAHEPSQLPTTKAQSRGSPSSPAALGWIRSIAAPQGAMSARRFPSRSSLAMRSADQVPVARSKMRNPDASAGSTSGWPTSRSDASSCQPRNHRALARVRGAVSRHHRSLFVGSM